ncbi:XkdX family protein [Schleiferilactobacillus harbinensis]|nr:XkdX family protein [Schleiferilactobacillus harbinensis]
MYSWGCPIEGYVANGAITADEYKQITGKQYVAPTN